MKDNHKLFEAANTAFAEGNYVAAIAEYKKILTTDPNHPQLLHFLGLAYAQEGEMQKALPYLEKALLVDAENASLYHHLGTIYKCLNLEEKAVAAFNKALQLEPTYAQAHHNLAGLYAKQKQYPKALMHYQKALHAAPDFLTAHYHLGLLFIKMQNKTAALTQFNNVLALHSEHLEANFYAGVLSLEDNQLEKAKAYFQQVLQLHPEHVEALSNRGSIALKQDQGQLAIDYFTKALAFDNQHEYARNNLAATFMHYDRFENALTHYQILLEKHPNNVEYHYNAGVAEMILGHLEKAENHFQTVLKKQANHAPSLSNLASIYLKLERKPEAQTYLEQAISANPQDESSQHLLTALKGDIAQPETRPEYAKNLFNNYALYYDKHMHEALKYTLPEHITALIKNKVQGKNKHSLDLGCGTGLQGLALREVSQTLTGVDIADKMLEKAKATFLYDKLIAKEILLFLQEESRHYDLILAADVLPYFGELTPLFQAIKSHLLPEGIFIFSTEISEKQGWHLQNNARFSHHPDYITALCKKLGFNIIYQEKVSARIQNNQVLAVFLWMVRING